MQNKKLSTPEDILKMVKDKCPKAFRGFLPNDEILTNMINQMAKVKGKKLA